MKNKAILYSTLLVMLFSVTLISGCKKEAKETCTDGVKNGTETGVDCGGSCAACSGLPVACFQLSNDTVPAGIEVTLTNCSALATSYAWNFGDGQTSTDQSPLHSYANTGTYTVSLIATNALGSHTATSTMVVRAITSADYAGNFSVNETCTSGTYNYTFGITADGPQNIILNNLGDFRPKVNATALISGLNFNIPLQLDSGFIVNGNGNLSANYNNITIIYSVDDNGDIDNCTANCVRQ
ncbi:MAG: PKD domain-containing protein [Bacteroidota bacterium]